METLPKINEANVKARVCGTYKHYKGGLFTVLGIGRHSETLEELVFYTHDDGELAGELWVRPRAMFFGTLEVDGKTVQRFEKVD